MAEMSKTAKAATKKAIVNLNSPVLREAHAGGKDDDHDGQGPRHDVAVR